MRLIDADKFRKILQSQGYKVVVEMLDEQPTAYDVEKVMTELDKAESVKTFGSLNSGNRLIPVKDAIDIVEAGGADE